MNTFIQPRFIDLFCGIGGMRLGFESAGCRCVFSSDWDKHAQQTYAANFDETPVGDIRAVKASDIPDHQILVGGFPCQPFSISGVSKKNSLGKPHGFKDKTQGTLFFEVAKIIDEKKPEAFVLENVKNLLGHDRGRTFKTIFETLDEELGYDIHFKIIDAMHFVPQHRERIFIVGFRKPRAFAWPEINQAAHPPIGEILEKKVPAKYTLTDHLWDYLQKYAQKHRAAGNGFGFGLVEDMKGHTRCLSARYYKDGSEILISQGKKKNPRRLTPRECARLMGFPETFEIPVSDTQAYKQFGNSVVVPLAEAVATQVVAALRSPVLSANKPRQLKLLASG